MVSHHKMVSPQNDETRAGSPFRLPSYAAAMINTVNPISTETILLLIINSAKHQRLLEMERGSSREP